MDWLGPSNLSNMRLGEKLSKLCVQKGLRPSDLARAVEAVAPVSVSTARRWLQNKAEPSLRQGLALAAFLGVPLEFLADDAQDRPKAPLSEDERVILRIAASITPEEAIRRLTEPLRG